MPLTKAYFEHQFDALKRNVHHNKCKYVLVHMDGSNESFVAAAFCIRVFGSEKVLALITPDVHTKHIVAAGHCDALGIKTYTVPVTLGVADILNQIRIAGIVLPFEAIPKASVLLSRDVVALVSQALNAYVVDKYYLNDFEYTEFGRLYELPDPGVSLL